MSIPVTILCLLAGPAGGPQAADPKAETGREPAPAARAAAPAGEDRGELIPFMAWAELRAPAALDAPLPAPPAAAGRSLPSLPVLVDLRRRAGLEPGFSRRPLASAEDAATFESSFGAALRAVHSSADPADDLALARKLKEAAEPLAADSGLRRLLLLRALALAAPLPDAGDLLVVAASELRTALWPDVPADLAARLLAAEALLARAARFHEPPEVQRALAEELEAAALELFGFQLRHGFLDEARETLARARREPAGRNPAGREPAGREPPGRGAAETEALRHRLEARLVLRERFQKLLREVEARSDDAARWGQLAVFILSALHNEPLGAAAATRAEHPALRAYASARALRSARAETTRVERILDLVPLAAPSDRPGLIELALERITDRLGDAEGEEEARLKTLRDRAEELLAPADRSRQSQAAATAMAMTVAARSAWVPSGVVLRKGRRYRISAEGKWSFSDKDGPHSEVDAAGDPRALLPPDNLPRGALVAQVGASLKTLLVGRELLLVAPESGELFLSMNEEFREFEDNSGSLVVRVEGPAERGAVPSARPPQLLGRWTAANKGRGNARELRFDGTCSAGAVSGTWVARSAREAVLRWSNGALESLLVAGPQAQLTGNSGRRTPLRKEGPAGP